ncbi:related to xylosidase/arabinosidase [Cephalotrichum gorgonifer]|uniref:Related to xylosidase/arabinosidase n=1 Tax=Cephalotrichum gorgonifer TaxID=2041049 RepID=A0AAE8ST29_9PEZI|nr:related to xylosidase/arabinosidase [Cephalotrichum gorgonifer]
MTGNAIHRQGQVSLLKSGTSIGSGGPQTGGRILLATGGLYAATIRHHAGIFYVVCTNALRNAGERTAKKENFIVSTRDIWKGEWSDPVYFDFEGIDPSLFFDDDGKIYVQGSATPGPATRINNFEIDPNHGKKLSEERTIWTGTGGVYPEGPHIYKRNGWYYLVIAEGGTHVTHSVTVARSRNIWGPFEPAPNNPVLTAHGTDDYFQHTGHCHLFQDMVGQWWAVCIGVRKDKEARYVMGRETCLTPAKWEGDWLSLERVKTDVKTHSGTQLGSSTLSTAVSGVDYVYVRDPRMADYRMDVAGLPVALTPTSVDLSDPEASPAFVGKRQRRIEGRSIVTLPRFNDAWPMAKLKFGLACYKDEHRYLRIYYDAVDSSVVFEIINSAQNISRTRRQALGVAVCSISFRIEYTELEYRLLYTAGTGSAAGWTCFATIDTLEMTDPDFVGPVIGVFSVAEGDKFQVKFEELDVD